MTFSPEIEADISEARASVRAWFRSYVLMSIEGPTKVAPRPRNPDVVMDHSPIHMRPNLPRRTVASPKIAKPAPKPKPVKVAKEPKPLAPPRVQRVGRGIDEMVTRRKSGQAIKEIAREMGRNREVVRGILRRVAESDEELLALLDAPGTAGGRPRSGDDSACKRGHPRSEMVSRFRKSSGKTFQECGACKRQTSREAKRGAG